MWRRIVRGGQDGNASGPESVSPGTESRRAYYRVAGWIPIRLTPLAPDAVFAAVQDLGLPDLERTLVLAAEPEELSAVMARLARIEEKLDRLLGASPGDAARPLSGRDRRFIVFSGTGLALDVDFRFRRGDAFRVDLLLPAPQSRLVRAVAQAVQDAPISSRGGLPIRLALAFHHIEPDERNALIAYSYDLQRVALRAKHEGAAARP